MIIITFIIRHCDHHEMTIKIRVIVITTNITVITIIVIMITSVIMTVIIISRPGEATQHMTTEHHEANSTTPQFLPKQHFLTASLTIIKIPRDRAREISQ